MTSSAAAALLVTVALWGPVARAGPPLVRFQEVSASFKPTADVPSGFATLGSYHSCKWSGAPDLLEDFLLASQMQDPVRAHLPLRPRPWDNPTAPSWRPRDRGVAAAVLGARGPRPWARQDLRRR